MNNNNIVLEVQGLQKYYKRGSETVKALDGVDFVARRGEVVSIVGPSGSGKTTLMNLISCLDTPTAGVLKIGDRDVTHFDESQLVEIRRNYIGFIFQQFYLIPNLYVIENVELPFIFNKKPIDKTRIHKILERVGLAHRMNHLPKELSGGEMQRVAVARALANQPEILLADEPTGNLDSKNAQGIYTLFKELSREQNLTIIAATHNPELANQTDRIIHMRDGKIENDELVTKEQSKLCH